MEISATGTPNSSIATSAPSGRAALSSDFNTFLKMLTVQMQNQDPLNPMESTEFAVQLATFSQVEQQVRTNELLNALSAQMAAGGMSQLAGWVGLEARVAAPVSSSAGPVELAFAARPGADRAELVVRNSQGDIVQRAAVDPAASAATWSGAELPDDFYSLTLTSFRGGAELGSDSVEHYATVREARTDGGAVTLLLSSGASVAPDAVHAVRQP